MKNFILLLTLCAGLAQAGTIIPFERDVPRIHQYYYLTSVFDQSSFFRTSLGADNNEELYFRGYSIINTGPNDIIPTFPDSMDYPSREFFISANDHAKRDTYIWVTDYVGSGRISDYFESIMVFLPRKNQPHVEEVGDNLILTLTTGEEVVLFKKYKTIIGGVLSEKALDFNPDRNQRKFVQLDYTGEGLIIRSDAKGNDPRLTKTAQIIKKGQPVCEIPLKEFWTQEGHPKFKFVKDEDAYALIKEKCGSEYIPSI